MRLILVSKLYACQDYMAIMLYRRIYMKVRKIVFNLFKRNIVFLSNTI